jgi:GABA(A) receptor-associated protein
MFKYQKIHPLEKRKLESARIRNEHPGRVPIIAEVSESSGYPQLDKTKYLCPTDMTLGQFVYIVTRRLKLQESQALFIFINNKIFPTEHLMSEIYRTEKHEDGFLYCLITAENTFGFQPEDG